MKKTHGKPSENWENELSKIFKRGMYFDDFVTFIKSLLDQKDQEIDFMKKWIEELQDKIKIKELNP